MTEIFSYIVIAICCAMCLIRIAQIGVMIFKRSLFELHMYNVEHMARNTIWGFIFSGIALGLGVLHSVPSHDAALVFGFIGILLLFRTVAPIIIAKHNSDKFIYIGICGSFKYYAYKDITSWETERFRCFINMNGKRLYVPKCIKNRYSLKAYLIERSNVSDVIDTDTYVFKNTTNTVVNILIVFVSAVAIAVTALSGGNIATAKAFDILLYIVAGILIFGKTYKVLFYGGMKITASPSEDHLTFRRFFKEERIDYKQIKSLNAVSYESKGRYKYQVDVCGFRTKTKQYAFLRDVNDTYSLMEILRVKVGKKIKNEKM